MLNDYTGWQQIPDPLLAWFDGNARVLPWRSDPAPYHVWVSEIMLQQTRVEAVRSYYERFLRELPDLHALAACPEDRLMKLWEGLGYYSRARNLQKAARQIEEEYDGQMPPDFDTLLKLPGIGRYTAGAVASIAFGRKAPAVDGNVLRVVTRLAADDSDIMKEPFRREVERHLLEILPDDRPGTFNQAMMELGAMVCVPNGAPDCGGCPLAFCCTAHQAGNETAYPVKAPKKSRRIEEKTILLIRDGDRMVLRRRPPKGLLAGLYEFPWEAGWLSAEEAEKAAERLGFEPLQLERLPAASHIFSHVEWHMQGWLIRVAETENIPAGMVLADRKQIEKEYPVPSAFAAYAEQMQLNLGLGG